PQDIQHTLRSKASKAFVEAFVLILLLESDPTQYEPNKVQYCKIEIGLRFQENLELHHLITYR
ncbi:unnamed protein product, partial [Dovyalis caffra]